jgi:glutamate decarboxylase
VIGQYYNLIRLGHSGYKSIMMTGMDNANYLREQVRPSIILLISFHLFLLKTFKIQIVSLGRFQIVDKQHMPLVAFALNAGEKFTVFDIQDHMKQFGWIIPAYTCSKGAENFAIMRVVVKQNFSRSFADLLIKHLRHSLECLDSLVKTQISHVENHHKSFKEILAAMKIAKRLHSHSTKIDTSKSGTRGIC